MEWNFIKIHFQINSLANIRSVNKSFLGSESFYVKKENTPNINIYLQRKNTKMTKSLTAMLFAVLMIVSTTAYTV